MIPIQVNGRTRANIDIKEIIKYGVLANSDIQEAMDNKSVREIISVIHRDEFVVINVVV